MPTNAITAISSKPVFKSTDTLLREWIVKFATLAEKELSKAHIALWCEALCDLEPEWIEFACRQYIRSMKFMPKPGDIRELVEQEKVNRQIQALRSPDWKRAEEINSALDEAQRTHRDVDEILREHQQAQAATA